MFKTLFRGIKIPLIGVMMIFLSVLMIGVYRCEC